MVNVPLQSGNIENIQRGLMKRDSYLHHHLKCKDTCKYVIQVLQSLNQNKSILKIKKVECDFIQMKTAYGRKGRTIDSTWSWQGIFLLYCCKWHSIFLLAWAEVLPHIHSWDVTLWGSPPPLWELSNFPKKWLCRIMRPFQAVGNGAWALL